MKIKRLWVSKYKNIENIDLEFQSDLVTLLVGRNGLGKSNLIEILALIFRDLDLLNTYEELTSWAYYEDRGQFEYIIEYYSRGNDIRITTKQDQFQVEVRTTGSDDFRVLDFGEWIVSKERLLPKYIIGYYSGENKRIQELIEPHAKIEKRLQRNWHRRKTLPERSLRRLFFAENKHSQLLLITLAVYKNNVSFEGLVNRLFHDYLLINSVDSFDIKFNNPRSRYYKDLNASANYFEENFTSSKIEERLDYPFWNLKGKIHDLISVLFNHHLENASYIIYENVDEGQGKEDSRRFVKEFLQLKDTKIREVENEIYEKFPHPIDFFNALEGCYNLEILSSISVEVKIANGTEDLQKVKFEQLSEGQQQILTVLGILLTTANDECLFLFDEPDTHVNPRWQRDYVNLLHNFNLNGENTQIILATHSALIVQSSERADVFLFKKDNGEVVIDTAPPEIHNWRIDQVLMSEYFGLQNVRPPSLDDFMRRREELLNKEILTEEDKLQLIEYNKRMKALPNGETLNDFYSMKMIREIIAEYKKT
ncbi:MAG: AAA family ATPase [Mesoflavibacter sp.]|nr:AAA family ATPase [Mesoflavibacter sp.]